ERFVNELIFVGERRAFFEPVSPDDGGKRTFAVRDDQVGGNAVAVGAGVVDFDEHRVAALLNVGFALLQAGLGVVVETRQQIRVCGLDGLAGFSSRARARRFGGWRRLGGWRGSGGRRRNCGGLVSRPAIECWTLALLRGCRRLRNGGSRLREHARNSHRTYS